MKIDKTSWHYKLYSLSFLGFNNSAKDATNLCSYVNRILLLPFILLIAGFVCIGCGVMCLIGFSMRLVTEIPFGSYPTSFLDLNSSRSYNGLKVGSISLYPAHVMGLALLVWLNIMLVRWFHVWYPSIAIDLFVFAMTVLVLRILGHITPSKDNIFKEYMKVKKAKMCPLIEFVDKEE